jgi:hypothetical protein
MAEKAKAKAAENEAAITESQQTADESAHASDGADDLPIKVQEHPAFKAITRQLTETRATLDAIKRADEDRKRKEEQSRLESEGKYKEVLAQKDAELAKLKADADAEVKRINLKYALAQSGLRSEIAVNGALATYLSGDGSQTIDDFVSALKKDPANKALFGAATQPQSDAGAPAIAGGQGNWADVRKIIESPETTPTIKFRAAMGQLDKWRRDNGKSFDDFPWAK